MIECNGLEEKWHIKRENEMVKKNNQQRELRSGEGLRNEFVMNDRWYVHTNRWMSQPTWFHVVIMRQPSLDHRLQLEQQVESHAIQWHSSVLFLFTHSLYALRIVLTNHSDGYLNQLVTNNQWFPLDCHEQLEMSTKEWDEIDMKLYLTQN